MEWVTTSLLLEQLRDFDNEVAWNKLVEFFRAPLAAFARRMGLVDNDADDLVQETLIAFASAYSEGKYDPEKGRLSDWLFGISYRQIQNARRKRARRDAPLARRSEDSFPFDELPDREEATRTWNEEWAKSLLANCLRRVRIEVEPNGHLSVLLEGGMRDPPDVPELQENPSRSAVNGIGHQAPTLDLTVGVDPGRIRVADALGRHL